MRHAVRALRVCAVFTASAVLVAACGSSGKKPTVAATTTVPNGGPATTSPALIPKPGGNLVIGTEAEIDGFDPTKNRWDNNGYLYAETVYDPLAVIGQDSKPHPYLAQSITPNTDYTTWTITLRPGVVFSNGDALTAADVVFDLKGIKNAPLTGSAFDPVSTIVQTGTLSLDVHMNEPWVPFPYYLAGQPGFIASPKTEQDPNGSRKPIGTGPFIFKEWVQGDHFSATKNPNYWRKGLPYLDSIEYRPIIEEQSRINSLRSGDIGLLITADAQSQQTLRSLKGVINVDDSQGNNERASSMVMLNTAKAPLNDPLVRQALAYATDRKRIIATEGEPFIPEADSPFGVGSTYHVANPGYPDYDLNKAKQLVSQWSAANGGKKLTFQLGTTNTAKTLADAQLIQDMWSQAGITVNIVQVEQSSYILNALRGNYDAYLWAQFGDPDPDADFVWWSSQTAKPIGQFSLNFARNQDPQLTADLETGRHSADQATRVAAYQDVAKRFAVDLPYIWISAILSDVTSNANVHGIDQSMLPDGTLGFDQGPTGFQPWHLWLSS
jgi:peptide/nickel transport system substrate-binding protein